MKTNERPNSDTRVDRQLRAGNAMYRGGYIAMIERQLAEARELIDEIETRHAATMMHTQAIVDDANSLSDQRDRLAEALEYIASSGLSARHLERIAAESLAAVKGGKQ